MKRPSTPASFIRLSVISGSLSEVSISTNSLFASLSARKRASMRPRLRVISLSAWGWMSTSCVWAAWKSRIIRAGSCSKTSSARAERRPPASAKPSTSFALDPKRGNHWRRLETCSASKAAQKMRVRSPTVLAIR